MRRRCAGLAPALGKTKYAERVVLLGYVVFLKQLLLVDNILIIIIIRIRTFIYLQFKRKLYFKMSLVDRYWSGGRQQGVPLDASQSISLNFAIVLR